MSRLPYRFRREATVYLAPDVLAPLVETGHGTLTVPIPTDLLHVEQLPGEPHPSAWIIERYIEKGEARQQCTRLLPFQGASTLILKVKHKRQAHWFHKTDERVEREGDRWVWRVFVSTRFGA